MKKYADYLLRLPGVTGVGLPDDGSTIDLYVKDEDTKELLGAMLREEIAGVKLTIVVKKTWQF